MPRMDVSELEEATPSVLQDINDLLKQLVHDPATYEAVPLEKLRDIIEDKKTIIVVARDGGHIVGMGLLAVITKFRGDYAYIEDMTVDTAHRGQGIGTEMTKQLIESARSRGVKTIELSTRPSRVPANNLYQK